MSQDWFQRLSRSAAAAATAVAEGEAATEVAEGEEASGEAKEAASEEEKNKLWHKFTSASSRLSNDRNAEYERRFKVDAILLRDELRSRLPDYSPGDRHRDSAYEHPTNYFGFNDVANDIETMAKLLATANKEVYESH